MSDLTIEGSQNGYVSTQLLSQSKSSLTTQEHLVKEENDDFSFFLKEGTDGTKLQNMKEATSSDEKRPPSTSKKSDHSRKISSIEYTKAKHNFQRQSSEGGFARIEVKRIVKSNRYSTSSIQMMSDKERFLFGKQNNCLEILLELIQSNDVLDNGLLNDSNCEEKLLNSQNNFLHPMARYNTSSRKRNALSNRNSSRKMGVVASSSKDNLSSQQSQASELKSDLKKEWMQQEQLVCHSALNQLSYILIQKKIEMKLHLYYNTEQLSDKIHELIDIRNEVLKELEANKSIEKRIQRFLLMGDDIGIQSSLYLLLILSTFEIKVSSRKRGYEHSPDTASSHSSIHSQANNERSQSIGAKFTSNQKKKIDESKIHRKFRTDWFKRHLKVITELIGQIMSDQQFSKNSMRVTILLLGNLHTIANISSFTKSKQTFKSLLTFFDKERDKMLDYELLELQNTLKKIYNRKELFQLTQRPTNHLNKDNNDNCLQYKNKMIMNDSTDSIIDALIHEKMVASSHEGTAEQNEIVQEKIINNEKFFEMLLKKRNKQFVGGSVGQDSQFKYPYQENQSPTREQLDQHFKVGLRKMFPSISVIQKKGHNNIENIKPKLTLQTKKKQIAQRPQTLSSNPPITQESKSKLYTPIDSSYIEAEQSSFIRVPSSHMVSSQYVKSHASKRRINSPEEVKEQIQQQQEQKPNQITQDLALTQKQDLYCQNLQTDMISMSQMTSNFSHIPPKKKIKVNQNKNQGQKINSQMCCLFFCQTNENNKQPQQKQTNNVDIDFDEKRTKNQSVLSINSDSKSSHRYSQPVSMSNDFAKVEKNELKKAQHGKDCIIF